MELKTWLEKNNVTAFAFADDIQVHHSAVSRYLSSERFPRPAILRRIELRTRGKVTANDFARQLQQIKEA
jgi:transcriptional regulator with XRE-family HTH domain